jgi:hypothetical protein
MFVWWSRKSLTLIYSLVMCDLGDYGRDVFIIYALASDNEILGEICISNS